MHSFPVRSVSLLLFIFPFKDLYKNIAILIWCYLNPPVLSTLCILFSPPFRSLNLCRQAECKGRSFTFTNQIYFEVFFYLFSLQLLSQTPVNQIDIKNCLLKNYPRSITLFRFGIAKVSAFFTLPNLFWKYIKNRQPYNPQNSININITNHKTFLK